MERINNLIAGGPRGNLTLCVNMNSLASAATLALGLGGCVRHGSGLAWPRRTGAAPPSTECRRMAPSGAPTLATFE